MVLILASLAVVLVSLGGFFAAAESAIATLPKSEIFDLAATTKRKGSLKRIASDQIAHITTCSFLRVLTQTGAAICVTLIFAYHLENWPVALLVSGVVMIVVSVILVGVSPRALGRRRATDVLKHGAFVIAAFRIVIGPVAALLSGFSGRLSSGKSSGSMFSEEHLLNLVDQANEQDVLEDEERELIHSVFEFGDTVVREAMVPRTDMVTVEQDATIGNAMGAFLSNGFSRIPVIGENVDHVLGVIYLRDVAKHYYQSPPGVDQQPITEFVKPASFVPESQKASELLSQMQRESNHMAIVIDEYGGVAGLVTMENLIEELIGNIADEYDREVQEIEQLDDGRYRISARLDVDELAELFDIELEDEDVDSVGGLLTKAFGSLPQAGSRTEIGGIVLTAERVEGKSKRLQTVVAEASPALLQAQSAFKQMKEEK